MSQTSNFFPLARQSFNTVCRSARALGLVVLSLASLHLHADTFTFDAITDFENINAGEVPYYIDTVADRNVLAIDAAVEEYREKFARALTIFGGDSGIYDVTITTLGEIDGEGEFRFLVNGIVVGAAVNSQVDEDWGEQFHVFENISIQMGDEIAVESDARSNGLIPENGEYAFARGRWRTLELVSDDAATANPVSTDLAVSLVLQPEEVEVASLVAAVVNVINIGSSVATNPRVDLVLPEELLFVSGDTCAPSDSDHVIRCSLAEIAPNGTAVIGLALLANETGSAQVTALTQANQNDFNPANNTADSEILIVASEAGSTATEVAATEATEALTEAANSESTMAAVDEATDTATSTLANAVDAAVNGNTDEVEAGQASGSSVGSGMASVLMHYMLLIGIAVRMRFPLFRL